MNKCKACEKNMDGWCQDPQFDDARSEFFTGESDCCEVCGGAVQSTGRSTGGVLKMIDESRLKEERDRVALADRIQARLGCIELSLCQMEKLPDVRISSPNCFTWHPNIPTEKVKQFVRDCYGFESAALRRQLSDLYPIEMG